MASSYGVAGALRPGAGDRKVGHGHGSDHRPAPPGKVIFHATGGQLVARYSSTMPSLLVPFGPLLRLQTALTRDAPPSLQWTTCRGLRRRAPLHRLPAAVCGKTMAGIPRRATQNIV